MAGERVLIVDDEEGMCQWLSIALKRQGYRVAAVRTGEEAIRSYEEQRHDCVISDIRMPHMDGLELLHRLIELDPECKVIMITAFGSLESAIEALRGGAVDYLTKPFEMDEVKHRLEATFERARLRRENLYLRRQLERTEQQRVIIGQSETITSLLEIVRRVAATESTVLISGESGTGKELVARYLHEHSPRSEGPFVTVSCAALPETLLESELFGHRKGAFTGAVRDKVGLFQVAERGSFFLDEIGQTPPGIQVKLLRVLQEREIIPVGHTVPIQVDVRLLAATNQDLEKAVHEGEFRSDLFYRLNVIPIVVPPLRDRREDITLLAAHFIERQCERLRVPLKQLSDEVLDLFMDYPWPGNVRELENVIERAVVLEERDVITPSVLPETLREGGKRSVVLGSLAELEREEVLATLKHCDGNKYKAARTLGIHPSTLYRKLKSWGVE